MGDFWAKLGLTAGDWRVGAIAVTLLVTGFDAHAQSADDQFLTVIVGSDTTIRQVANEYLSDPDLWPEILATPPGSNSIADLNPGMELRIPVNEITGRQSGADRIARADPEGQPGRRPDLRAGEIELAVDLHEQALAETPGARVARRPRNLPSPPSTRRPRRSRSREIAARPEGRGAGLRP